MDRSSESAFQVSISYPESVTCWSQGWPQFTLWADESSGESWLDIGDDGVADVVRQGDSLYFRSVALPRLARWPKEWVVVDLADPKPADEFVQVTSLWRMAYTLTRPEVTNPMADLADLISTAPSNPFPLDPEPGMSSSMVSWEEAPDGSIERVTVTSPNVENDEPRAGGYDTLVAVPIDPVPAPDREIPTDAVSPVAELPAVGLLLDSTSPGFPCSEIGDITVGQRSCVENLVGTMTIGEWLAQGPQSGAAEAARACADESSSG